MAIADRIVVMNQGRIEDDGTPARVYKRPKTLFAAGFMGEMNRIPAQGLGDKIQTPFGLLDHAGQGALTVCVRPEALSKSEAGQELGRAIVQDAAFFGTHVRAHVQPVDAPELTMVAHLPAGSVPSPGDEVALRANPDDLLVFATE